MEDEKLHLQISHGSVAKRFRMEIIMKKFKKLAVILSTIAAMVLLPMSSTMTVRAEEPVTYYLKYVDNEGWRFQVGSAWDSNLGRREIYYLQQDIKDGDLLVVEGSPTQLDLRLSVKLSNLTLKNAATVVVGATSIQDLYVLEGSVAAVNGDITNAYLYNGSACTINNNVTNLHVIGTYGLTATVNVVGDVAHVVGRDDYQTFYEYYNVATGKMYVKNGTVQTEAQYYSTTAPAETPQPTVTPQPPAGQNTQQPSSSEYDDVPKTGESSIYLWLLSIAGVCLAGSYTLKKSIRR